MDDAPPPYEAAVASSSSSDRKTRNGIPPSTRRSMEDEQRPLPKGWVRSFDSQRSHQFFVDTSQNPPRAIWHHPYDDEQYLGTLSSSERERIQSLSKTPSKKDMEAESTDEESDHKHGASSSSSYQHGATANTTEQKRSGFGRKLKDRLTQSTHEERETRRQQRAEEERRAYEAHMAFRQAMTRAMQTGQPQFVAKDRDGKDIDVEPPGGARPPPGSRGVNPYSQGPYTDPNARFIRPPEPAYARPYGGGFGGGMGLPIAGGLAGGLLLGGLLGGF